MPSLVNMRLSDTERKDEVETIKSPFPYGLSLHLDMASLEKLGMTALPEVGKEFNLVAKAVVESVRESMDESGEDKSVGLQITELALEPSSDNEPEVQSQADTLFGNAPQSLSVGI